MDRREMKKHILYFALWNFDNMSPSDQREELKLILDKEPTLAEFARFHDLLQKMVENASSKLK
jgi:hypothetical protein